ncbi:YqgE/AlgH family protein [Parasphingorhabdus sp.]|uniref:YqgE/AlgH family protein n=1 Tax=Parasphingorhabdus sp. TaxID=2709688 RepID=UPI003296F8FB
MDLTGQLLIAMPGMSDPRFERSVIFMCAYSDEGAMGLILNKNAGEMTLRDVFKRLDIKEQKGMGRAAVHVGGPVDRERGFVLHIDKRRLTSDALAIRGTFVLSATQEILNDIADGKGPSPFVFALGYSGWSPGQLEGEIAQNGWLTAPATPDLVFAEDGATMWDAAIRSIGIDPITLSAAAGRA